ncbi:MAG TPA: FGGY-family carbohydrate kinase [Sedimentisphaerales bacterium]|nr:FGGY-family carbohydrate kinase [Sedimentisphaerales bacterium]
MSCDSLIAGIDVGTSAVKVLCVDRDAETVAVRVPYGSGSGTKAWFDAIKKCFEELGRSIELKRIDAVAMACQVNTYILFEGGKAEGELVILDWAAGEGREQLEEMKRRFSTDYFLRHISMPHPDMISYPLPRLAFLQENFPDDWERTRKILQPKDSLYYRLTGVFASDAFTWRGLSNIEDSSFHEQLLKDHNIRAGQLPYLYSPFSSAGRLSQSAAEELKLAAEIEVYLGCNDFFAGLLGMGVTQPGQYFDVTGTSEHVGRICDEVIADSKLVSGPYFNGFVEYGVTSGSGVSLEWGQKMFGDHPVDAANQASAPIFLPYLKGERAPIWDSMARGVFFGLDPRDESASMSYAVREGVVFGLYDIFRRLDVAGDISDKTIRTGGVAAQDDSLTQLKADVFRMPFEVVKEKESTALGAAMIAAVGKGWYSNIHQAAGALVDIEKQIEPNPAKADSLKRRFEIYVQLYPALRDLFHRSEGVTEMQGG